MSFDNISIRRQAILNSFQKGKELPVGTIRTHGKQKVIKTADGWRPYKEESKQKQTKEDHAEIVNNSNSKSAKARQLADKGVSTAKIAKMLDMHYSHAYSVIKKHKSSNKSTPTKIKTTKKQAPSKESDAEIKQMQDSMQMLLESGDVSSIETALMISDNANIPLPGKKELLNLHDDLRKMWAIDESNVDNDKIKDLLTKKELIVERKDVGSFPKNISKMKSLRKIRFQKNLLSKLPDEFSQLSYVKEIDFHQHNFSKFPEPLLKMPNLETLDLGTTYGDVSIERLPKDMSGMKSLKELDLANNEIGDISPLKTLPNLKKLTVNVYEKSDLKKIAQISSLRELHLNDHDFSDSELKAFQKKNPNIKIYE